MKTKAICSFFVLFAIVAGIGATTPAAFAQTEVTITPAEGSSVPGCEDTNECWTPSTATVDVGGKVIFSNTDFAMHTFTAGTVEDNVPSPSGEFDSSFIMPDDSFEYTADTVGEIPFYCTVHAWMTGLLIVVDSEAEAQAAADAAAEAEAQATAEAEAQAAADAAAEAEAQAAADAAAEEVMVEIVTGTAEAGEMLSIDVTFTTISGDSVEHVNYDITATQNGEVVLNDMGVHDHDGVMNHMTSALPNAASDDAPVQVEVMFNGFGIDPPFTGPIGQVSEMQVVPEFGTIAMMVLAVAIISIVAVTAKSRVVPRF